MIDDTWLYDICSIFTAHTGNENQQLLGVYTRFIYPARKQTIITHRYHSITTCQICVMIHSINGPHSCDGISDS